MFQAKICTYNLFFFAGDFAVLLRAGMTVKQALVYNCVSSILCLVGMVTGIGVGNLEAATQWIFALIAGMFIYIALVDMVRYCLFCYACTGWPKKTIPKVCLIYIIN